AAAPLGTSPLLSPGLMPRHYAPRAPVECVEGDGASRVGALQALGVQVGWLTFHAKRTGSRVVAIEMPTVAAAYATQLYAALHKLDDAGVERIVVELPPPSPEWLAVRDRLLRAGAQP